MNFRTMLGAGFLMVGVGCGVEEYAPVAEQVAEPVQVAQQAATVTRTITWPVKAPNKNCQFGVTTAGNQAARNSYASGRLEEPLSISGLAGQRIVSLRLRTPSAVASSFKYDDIMLIHYNKNVVLASDRRVATYSAGAAAGPIDTTPVSYVWSNILNKDIGNAGKLPAWCGTGASICNVPPTETVGTMDVYIPDFKGEDALAYPTAPDVRTFTLVTIGDNDDGTFNSGAQTQDIDCAHGEIRAELTITTEPAIPQPQADDFTVTIDQLTALHPGCNANQLLQSDSYTRDCIAAAHRFCVNNGFEAGVPTEIALPNVNIDCFRATVSQVNIAALTNLQADCNANTFSTSPNYTRACNSAASTICRNRGWSSGLVQEIALPNLLVNCVKQTTTTGYQLGVPFSTWAPYHPTCTVFAQGDDVTRDCRVAARRYCAANVSGALTGIVDQWGAGANNLACILK